MIANSRLSGQGLKQFKVLVEMAEPPLEDSQPVINPIQHAIHAQQEMMNIGLRDSGESSSYPHSVMRLQAQATHKSGDEKRATPVAVTPPQAVHSHNEYQEARVSEITSAALKLQHEQE